MRTEALKLIACGKLTFDERAVHCVVRKTRWFPSEFTETHVDSGDVSKQKWNRCSHYVRVKILAGATQRQEAESGGVAIRTEALK